MQGNPLLSLPTNSPLLWALKNPDSLAAAIAKINRLQNLKVSIVPAGGNNSFPITPVDSPQGMVMPIPLQFATPQADATTTVGNAVATTGATNSSPFGYTGATQANAIVTNVNALRVDVLALKATVNALLAQLRLTNQNPTP